jgi:hypothetical protein
MLELSKASLCRLVCVLERDLLEIVSSASLLKMLIDARTSSEDDWVVRRLIDIWHLPHTAASHRNRRNNNQMWSFSRTFLPKKIKPLALCYLNHLLSTLEELCLPWLPERCLWLEAPQPQETQVRILYCSISAGWNFLPLRAVMMVRSVGICKVKWSQCYQGIAESQLGMCKEHSPWSPTPRQGRQTRSLTCCVALGSSSLTFLCFMSPPGIRRW